MSYLKVKIEDNLYLESDGTQYILKQYSGKQDKKGNELYKTLGYYGTVPEAVKRIVNLRIMQSTATSLKELSEDIKTINLYVESKFEERS
ncbi:replication initiation protein [Bacillus phage Shbh1]|uniref:DUF5405 domain-containing protein n=1 Tax=Bacillus phage Shbh1 TaxID=1796992 RepID=A0A142F1A5_9CAUD|nr:replication initiation protein [Bacillus phage Shbh1]AMQ66562.1 hypothetical protein [Bacillus phage Shbh1]